MTNEKFKEAISIAYDISNKDVNKDKEEIESLLAELKEITDKHCDEYDSNSHLFLSVFKKLTSKK